MRSDLDNLPFQRVFCDHLPLIPLCGELALSPMAGLVCATPVCWLLPEVSVQTPRLIFTPGQNHRKERKRRDNSGKDNGIGERHDYLPFYWRLS